ncbi:SusC/RagA family TonB-linked outer membrane protein [Sphingobacterium faecale]|uniref:SusC/RagA family TonB-linked outer membrane protein n=1 Tax=Sphingobacterium faecale TaxID=2803775 RepID=A0ABS1R3Q9_9SPHI|nr:SusC/RagA family TonB-linked outer membrane protein [Sphingobacterium faecale]MBL1409184.1 SusC/RagA family TonB-linked outer membrane protein [Sphingobacterium faecale]
MRLIVFFLVTGILHTYATGNAQTITGRFKNSSLQHVLSEIRKQTDYTVFGAGSILKDAHPITIDVENMPIIRFLDEVFYDQPIRAQIQGKTILLSKKKNVAQTDQGTAHQMQLQIQGKVVDDSGHPLIGASVVVLDAEGKRTKKHTNTDRNGHFALNGIAEGTLLEINFLGYATTKATATRSEILIKMKPVSKEVDDVVVTGYNVIKKESFTGNSIRVSQEELLKVGNRNVVDVLQVFDPSFRLEVNNIMGSDPNTLPEFYIRGRSGIGVKSLDQVDISEAALTNNPNLPIFIMDGYEVSAERVYDYDLTRIKSITILKDAAATAVYGSRSANGVVVIETIAPEPGKLRLDYNMVSSLALADLSDYNLMNAKEKLEAEKLAGVFALTPDMSFSTRGSIVRELLLKENQLTKGVNTDWIAQPVRNEFNHKHTLNIDGGSQDLRFNFLLKYDKQNGVMKGSSRERKGGGLGIDYRQNNFQIRNDFTYDIVDAEDSPYGSFSAYTTKLPYDEIFGADGFPVKNTPIWHSGDLLTMNIYNPIYEVFNTHSFSKNGYNNVNNNTAIIWNFLPNFQLKADLALTKQDSWSDQFTDPSSGKYFISASTNFENIGELNLKKIETIGYNTNLFVRYDNKIGSHNFNFSGGFNARENKTKSSVELYSGFPSGEQNSPNFANKIVRKPNYNDNHTRLIGSFIALNYSLKDIYLLDLSGRLDGSSEFGSENRVAPFWSLGAGINLHKYSWLKSNSVINRLRLTTTTGELGKTNFPPYAARGMYVFQQNWYATGNGALLVGMESPTLTWEKTKTHDIIMDLGLWNDKLNVNFNWYNKLTNNLVNDVDLPLSSGFSSYKDNIGKVRNSGYEIFLRGNIITRKDFNFSVYGNFASNKNELLQISSSLKKYNDLVNAQYDEYGFNRANSPHYLDRYSTPHTKYIEGGSLTSIFAMQSLGINPMDGKEIFVRPDGTITYDWDASDQVIVGDTSPKGQGAFGFNLAYKGFTVFASFLYQYGAQEYNRTLVTKVENVDIYNKNADRRVLLDRWNQIGDITSLKDIRDRAYTTRPTSRFVQNNDFVKFNSLSIGYDLPIQVLQKYKLTRLRLQLSSNSLGTWSTIRQERGTTYPFARNYDLSVKVVF